MLIKTSGITDVGLKRERNEDSFSIDDDLGLYVVADGMGGHQAGDVASRIAVELINKSYRNWADSAASEDEIFGEVDRSLSRKGNYVLGGIRLANRVIHELSIEYEQYGGMGTTVAIIAVMSGLVIAANVGDSRIYMIRNGQIERLSKDHTFVAEQIEMGIISKDEARISPLKHILTRNLGSSKYIDPEAFELVPANGDRYILCSDGLTDLISDDEILAIVQGEDNPEALCRKFVDEALKRGGHDNTTVVSVFITGIAESETNAMKRMGIFLADFSLILKKVLKKFKP